MIPIWLLSESNNEATLNPYGVLVGTMCDHKVWKNKTGEAELELYYYRGKYYYSTNYRSGYSGGATPATINESYKTLEEATNKGIELLTNQIKRTGEKNAQSLLYLIKNGSNIKRVRKN